MKSLEVANLMIVRYDGQMEITNLKLNKLVYFAQAVSLRKHGKPLFEDAVQAWDYGPVEPMVYHAFSRFGRNVIRAPQGSVPESVYAAEIVDDVMTSYGKLTAFDLVRLSHRKGSAWAMAYQPKANAVITTEMILRSDDGVTGGIMNDTLAGGVMRANRMWPNAMRMLENS